MSVSGLGTALLLFGTLGSWGGTPVAVVLPPVDSPISAPQAQATVAPPALPEPATPAPMPSAPPVTMPNAIQVPAPTPAPPPIQAPPETATALQAAAPQTAASQDSAPQDSTPQDSAPPPGAEPAQPAPLTDAEQEELLVLARKRHPGDPMAELNAASFAITEAVDKAVMGPMAMAVERNVPKPITDGLHNFLYNVHEPVVFLNFLLQIKPGKAAETLGRFLINSTIGIAGLFDVAKKRPFKLPYRHNGLANTFGYYGIGPGPFLFLPLIGSSSLRDFIGDSLDRVVVPLSFGTPFNQPYYTLPTGVLRSLDRRADFDEKLRKLREAADPYAARREYYLGLRQAEIDGLRGKRRQPVPSPSQAVSAPTSVASPDVAPAPLVVSPPAPAPQPAAPPPPPPPGL